MLFRRATLERIAAGEVTLAFRRWRRPTVSAGGRLRTAAGVLAIGAVERCEASAIGDAEARRAGYAGRDALLADLAPEGDLYRVAFSLAGPDPREALRADVSFTPQELARLEEALARLDGHAPWTVAALRLIGESEGLAAAGLALRLGMEKPMLKRNIRKLKELGLTESLAVGYRLSRRGMAVLAAVAAGPRGR